MPILKARRVYIVDKALSVERQQIESSLEADLLSPHTGDTFCTATAVQSRQALGAFALAHVHNKLRLDYLCI